MGMTCKLQGTKRGWDINMAWKDIIKQDGFFTTGGVTLTTYSESTEKSILSNKIKRIESKLENLFNDLKELDGEDVDENTTPKELLEKYNLIRYASTALNVLNSDLRTGKQRLTVK